MSFVDGAPLFRSRTQAVWVGAVALLVSVVSLVLRAGIPVSVPPESGYDDGLFVRQATFLSDGSWLGPFDLYTLIKGPAFPGFIALTHALHVPLMVAEQAVLLLAAAVLAVCVVVLLRRPVVSLLVYAVIALDPAAFSSDASRVLRDSWYSALTLLLVASFFLAVLAACTGLRRWVSLACAALAGLVLGVAWLTREETPVVVPALVVTALLVPWIARRTRDASEQAPAPRFLRPYLLALGVSLVAAVVPVVAVAAANSSQYGVRIVNDITSGTFAAAYADWTGVQAGPTRPLVPISRAQREAVYRVSPAAAEMRPILEDPKNGWVHTSCVVVGVCDDLAGGWTLWAMRIAADKNGHFSSAVEAQAYFGQIRDDIRAACADGRLTCHLPILAALQPFQRAQPLDVVSTAAQSLGYVLTSPDLVTAPGPLPAVSAKVRADFHAVVPAVPPSQAKADQQAAAFDGRRGVYDLLAAVSRVLLPVATVAGLAGCVLLLLGRHRPRGERRRGLLLVVLAGSLLVAALSRLGFLAVVATTSFPVASTYQQPTRLLLLAFAVVGCAGLADVVLSGRARAGGSVSSAG